MSDEHLYKMVTVLNKRSEAVKMIKNCSSVALSIFIDSSQLGVLNGEEESGCDRDPILHYCASRFCLISNKSASFIMHFYQNIFRVHLPTINAYFFWCLFTLIFRCLFTVFFWCVLTIKITKFNMPFLLSKFFSTLNKISRVYLPGRQTKWTLQLNYDRIFFPNIPF